MRLRWYGQYGQEAEARDHMGTPSAPVVLMLEAPIR